MFLKQTGDSLTDVQLLQDDGCIVSIGLVNFQFGCLM